MPAPPSLLAFDTATETLVAAACGPHGRSAAAAPGGAAATAGLLPLAEAQLAAAGLGYADLDAIAFGRGPGAFTGLRTSCAVAQGLGFGLGRPLLPIDSLLVVAEDARVRAGIAQDRDAIVAVAMDARMDEVYAARYAWHGGRWQVLDAPALYTLPALAAAWQDSAATLLAGNAAAVFGERLVHPRGALACDPERDRAGALLRLAEAAWAEGAAIDPALALPLYLRDKVALTTAEREQARAAALPSPTP
jgi:tRNA threonylcarbamoyladenosine biosynthesis protein TsaB